MAHKRMSKRTWQFLFAEFKTVRVTCGHATCGIVVEVPTEKLDQHFATMQCPACGRLLFKALAGDNPFVNLAKAFRQFTQQSNDMQIEFVAEDPRQKPAPSSGGQLP